MYVYNSIGKSDSGNNGKKIGMIAGISAGGAVVLGGIITDIVFTAKRTNLGQHNQATKKNEEK